MSGADATYQQITIIPLHNTMFQREIDGDNRVSHHGMQSVESA